MRTDFGQLCAYKKVIKYEIHAECREPLHIGTGSGKSGEVLIHPVENRPFVQAAGIAGAFRDFYSYDSKLQQKMFGSACQEDLEEEAGGEMGMAGGSSRVYITDGFFEEAAVYTELRPRLKICRKTGTGQAAETKGSRRNSGQKFEMESISAGSRFAFSMYLYEKDEDYEGFLEQGLKALQEGAIQLGGQKTNGCGYIKLLSVKKAVYDFYRREDRKAWARESKEMEEALPSILKRPSPCSQRLQFILSGKTAGGMLVKAISVTDGAENAPDAVNIRNHQEEYILPASSIKGVIRSQMEKIAARLGLGEECVAGIFEGTSGKLHFYDSPIGRPKENEKAGIQHRIHIDKFTGGVMYGSLFSEKPAYGELAIRIDLEEGHDRTCGLLLLALRDLGLGLLPLGSGSSIGRGYLEGDRIQVKKGAEDLLRIDCRARKIETGAACAEKYLSAAKPGEEG